MQTAPLFEYYGIPLTTLVAVNNDKPPPAYRPKQRSKKRGK